MSQRGTLNTKEVAMLLGVPKRCPFAPIGSTVPTIVPGCLLYGMFLQNVLCKVSTWLSFT